MKATYRRLKSLLTLFLAYRSGLLPNLYFAAAQRAWALSVRMTEQDWTSDSFNPVRSGLG